MNSYSALSSDFMEKTNEAFQRFQTEKVPFSALRLAIPGDYANDAAFDQVVKKHLRETDKVLGNQDDFYAILMEGTSFDAAVSASKRLAGSLLQLHKTRPRSSSRKDLQASFEIIGCKTGSDHLCRTYLDLNSPWKTTVGMKPIPREVQVYLDASQPMSRKSGNHDGMVNIKV
ncbi:MAG: hypothetical protein FP816_15860 [Desulfobacteraceae bacterium]|nr:hypothetical protein [Desulfobacteraceae bacterium]MBU4055864.1 hypothetical protein [Pseudomonadota bacterium]